MALTPEDIRAIAEAAREHGDFARRQPAQRAQMNEHRDTRASNIGRGETELVKIGKERLALNEKILSIAEKEKKIQEEIAEAAEHQQKILQKSTKTREEIARLEQQEADLQDSLNRTKDASSKRIYGQQLKQYKEGLKRKRIELNATMKESVTAQKTLQAKAKMLGNVQNAVRGATDDMKKLGEATQKLGNIKYPKTSPIANILAGKKGSGILDAVRAFKTAGAANAERTALGIGGHVSPMREAAGAFGNSGGGAGADLALAFARGGPGGLALEGGKKALAGAANVMVDVGDKLMRLAAIHKKATNSIEDNSEDAVSSMTDLSRDFAVAYGDTVAALMRYGVGDKEAYALTERYVRSIRPMKDMSKQLTQLAIDTQRFAIGFNTTADQVASDSEGMFAQFGMQQPKITEAYESMYSVFNEANKKTIKGFDEIIVRMDDWAGIVHDSSRRAGLWTFSHGAMADMMARVAEETAKGNMALAQRKQLGSTVAGMLSGQGPEFIEYQAGEMFMKDVMKEGAGTKSFEEFSAKIGSRYGDLKEHQMRKLYKLRDEVDAGDTPLEIAGKVGMAGISGGKTMEFRGKAFQNAIAGGKSQAERAMMLKSMGINLDDDSLFELAGMTSAADFGQKLRDKSATSNLGKEKTTALGGGISTGAGAIGAAETGMANMLTILAESEAELVKIRTSSDITASILEKVFGSDMSKRRISAIDKKLGGMTDAEAAAVKELKTDPTYGQEYGFGLLSTMSQENFLKKDEEGRLKHIRNVMHTGNDKEGQDRAKKLYDSFIGRASTDAAQKIASDESLTLAERHNKLKSLVGYSDVQATQFLAERTGGDVGDTGREIRRTNMEEANRRASENLGGGGLKGFIENMFAKSYGTLDVKNKNLTISMPVEMTNADEAVSSVIGEANGNMPQTNP